MKELKKQIRESFFNPILYFLPLLFFIVMDDFFGLNNAWKISFPIALGLIFYVYIAYNRLFLWHLMLSVSYIVIGLVASLISESTKQSGIFLYDDEILFILLMVFFLFRKSNLERFANKTLPHEMPMSNNVNELFRIVKILLTIVSVYTIVSLLSVFKVINLTEVQIQNLKYLYLFCLLSVGIYETIRVYGIRNKLFKEDWVPIVDERGHVTGSCQFQQNIIDQGKLMHPVIRLNIISNGMVFLQQRKSDDFTDPSLWDAAVSRHVRMTESVQQCLRSRSKEFYSTEPAKFMFLTNYKFVSKADIQYVYLFITCKAESLDPQPDKIQTTKWWTGKQIEDNINTGIFTERFKIEFELLKRSGILETESCECDCELKNILKSNMEKENRDSSNIK